MAKLWPNTNLSKIDLDNKYEMDKKTGGQKFLAYWKREADSWLFKSFKYWFDIDKDPS